jgi:hypothetical protein
VRREALLVGGPFDGAALPPAPRGSWLWAREVITRSGPKVQGYQSAGPKRQLYRFETRDGEADVYVFAELTHAVCGGCGGLNALTEVARCGLCGAALRSDLAPR